MMYIAAVLLYHDRLEDRHAAGLTRHDLPGYGKHGNTILDPENGKMTDIQEIRVVITHLVAGIMKGDGE